MLTRARPIDRGMYINVRTNYALYYVDLEVTAHEILRTLRKIHKIPLGGLMTCWLHNRRPMAEHGGGFS